MAESLDKWDDADKESWEALVVARHAADHTDGHIAVTESGHSVRYMWPESISKRETKLRALYERRLGSNEVLPSLERVLALVQAEVK